MRWHQSAQAYVRSCRFERDQEIYCRTCLVTESTNSFANIYHICCNVAEAKDKLGCNGQHAVQYAKHAVQCAKHAVQCAKHAVQSAKQTALAHNGERQKP
jgi:late competence protein required for DNA uptake (superfamily II DNA/RNA helicase)